MTKQWKLIAACAALGLLIAAFFFVFVGILGIVDGTLYTAMSVLCPPSVLSIPFSEAMKDKGGLHVKFSFLFPSSLRLCVRFVFLLRVLCALRALC